jgi:hypothetical protein
VDRLRKTGLALLPVGLALAAGLHFWVRAHARRAVDVPINLSIGHCIVEFTPHLTAPYEISIDVDENIAKRNNFPLATLNCLLGMPRPIPLQKCDNTPSSLLKCIPTWSPANCENTPAVVDATWTLSSDAKIGAAWGSSDEGLGRSSEAHRNLGGFDAYSGQRYTLDINFLKDGSRLAVLNPRLTVFLTSEVGIALWLWYVVGGLIAILLWLIGITLLLISFLKARRKKATAHKEAPIAHG